MPRNITYKVLGAHLVEGCMKTGSPIGIRIDQTLTQDATGTMAYLQFESIGLERVRNELAVSYVDHNTVQVGFENADDHRYLQSVAASKGVVFSRAGNGICHQVHLERFGECGKTLLGSDSHTPTGGGLGMVAIGAGGLDVALAMAGVPFSLICPRVVEIRLHGRLRPFVTAKDVILTVLERFGVKGNVNTVFEYTGDGVATLSVPERATICNMGAECGVTFSIFPCDEVTRAFLAAQGRADAYHELSADDGASYDDLFEIDLSTLEPMAACPHSPGNVKRVAELAGMKVDQVLIGSCTNSSYADMVKVGRILEGRQVPPSVSFAVAPGSRQVLMMITRDGTLEKMERAGARVLECACGFCIGNHQSPATDAVSLRTNNRNFEGRSGTKSAQVYLVSPEVAALSALAGMIVDPLAQHEVEAPGDVAVDRFLCDDGMLVFPPEDGSGVEILRGPNIGQPPRCKAMEDTVRGLVSIKVGDKITTDHIMPAGARLKYRSNIPVYSTFVFENVDPDFHVRSAALRDEGRASFIVAGWSYGQGSSREHAAICPMYLGVKAVMALSIERIHQANLCNFGIMPLTIVRQEDYDEIAQGHELVIDDAPGQVRAALEGRLVEVRDLTNGRTYGMRLDVTARQADMLIDGGRLNQMRREMA